jgi:ABC-type branched-subunit amino acid transport system ATPase component/sugar phosphate permease
MADQGGDAPLFGFTVPDELLREAVARSRDPKAVAALEMIPGTGEGKPPPLVHILREGGVAPLALLTLAALVTGTISNGIGLLGPEIQKSFRLSDAGLGAVTFVAAVSQIGWGLPVAVISDRGSRKLMASLTMIAFAALVPLMALSRNVWPFTLLYILAAVGYGTSDTVHNSYLADAYPTHARARIFAYHNLADPISQTAGIWIVGIIASATGDWRWSLMLATVGIPVGVALLFIREPAKGANESSHILKAAGMDTATQQEAAPKVLLGPAVQRLLRIKSLYYQLVAVAILGFAGTGIPLFGSLYFKRVWHLGPGQRGHVYLLIGLSAFLGLPVAYLVGDRFFRRAPQLPLVLAGASITVYGGLFAVSLYLPHLWMVVLFQFLANAAIAPLSISIFQTLAATAPAEMRGICFGLFGVYSLVFGGFAGAVLLGAISDATRSVTTALTLIGPVCAIGGVLLAIGSRYVRQDITLVIEDVLERYSEGERRKAGGAIPALQIHNLDFFYGTQQVLFDIDLEVAQGEMVALLGTNGAGKSTLLRAVAGLDHPHRGVIRLFGANTTYLEPEQILDEGAALLVGGKMTLPGLTVRDNLRVGGHSFRKDGGRAHQAFDEAMDRFPELAGRLTQPAGTLSGGEQQMLALARVLMTQPRLLMIDELTLGLAPMMVERLMEIVRRVNADGTTVILVEQSLNRALSLAEHAFFLERGTVRFDGPTAELMTRDDLLRPVFLTSEALDAR